MQTGNRSDFLRAMRPGVRPEQFADRVDFKIRAIRNFAKRILGHQPTDYQILFVCRKAGLLHRKLRKLEYSSETELMTLPAPMNRRFGGHGMNYPTANFYSGRPNHCVTAMR